MAYSRTWALALFALPLTATSLLPAQTCTTQSAMQPAERDALAAAGREIAAKIQSNDTAGLKALTVPEYAKDFNGMSSLASETAPHLKGAAITVDQVYLLDGSKLKADSTDPAQFFCALNHTANSVDFTITGLTPGQYGFVIVDATAAGSPSWSVPLILRQDGGRWLLAGFYPHASEAAGHDGVWYWREARRLSTAKELWNSWLFYEEATSLLRPVGFVDTTHLNKLQDEQRDATPPQLSNGVSAEVPLVVRGTDNTEFRVTRLAPHTLPDKTKLFVLMQADAAGAKDYPSLQKRAEAAASALIAAYPELKKEFGGVYVALESDGRVLYTQERPIA